MEQTEGLTVPTVHTIGQGENTRLKPRQRKKVIGFAAVGNGSKIRGIGARTREDFDVRLRSIVAMYVIGVFLLQNGGFSVGARHVKDIPIGRLHAKLADEVEVLVFAVRATNADDF